MELIDRAFQISCIGNSEFSKGVEGMGERTVLSSFQRREGIEHFKFSKPGRD